MALLTPIVLSADSSITDLLAQLVASAGGGDSYYGAGNELVVVNNGGGAPITVTIVGSGKSNFGDTTGHDLASVINAGKVGLINVNTMPRFRDTNSNVQITYSGVTSVTIGVFRLGRSDR